MRAFSLALLSTCAVLGPTMARAELPPWAYGEQQRQAPVVLRMAVEQGVNRGGDLHVQGRVLQVIRQPKSGQIKAGQRIWLVYGMPEPRPVAMVGPAPVRRPTNAGYAVLYDWIHRRSRPTNSDPIRRFGRSTPIVH